MNCFYQIIYGLVLSLIATLMLCYDVNLKRVDLLIIMVNSIQFLIYQELLDVYEFLFRRHSSHYIYYSLYSIIQYFTLSHFWPTLYNITPYHDMVALIFLLLIIAFFIYELCTTSCYISYSLLGWSMVSIVTVMIGNFHMIVMRYDIWYFILPILLLTSYKIGDNFIRRITSTTPWHGMLPMQTREGFITGLICICATSVILGFTLIEYPLLFKEHDVIIPTMYQLRDKIHVQLAPIQVHLIMLSLLISIYQPLISMFISGFKQAYHLKTFGCLITNYGGVSDIALEYLGLGCITYCYYQAIIQ